jgi:hypothetical protein
MRLKALHYVKVPVAWGAKQLINQAHVLSTWPLLLICTVYCCWWYLLPALIAQSNRGSYPAVVVSQERLDI